MSKFEQSERIFLPAPMPQSEPFKPPKRPVNAGPSKGYDSADKNQWRLDVWAQIAACIKKGNRPHSNVFLIEGTEGFEIDRVLSLGFCEDRLFVCNANPAVVASLKRRYPAINTYGVSAERALRRIYRSGEVLTAANLDFCSCLSASVIETLWSLRSTLADFAVVGVNLMRGREQKPFLMDGTTGDEAAVGFTGRGKDGGTNMHMSQRKKFQALSANDKMRLIWTYVSICSGQGDADIPPEEHVQIADGECKFLYNPNDMGRKGHIRSWGIYRGFSHLTMLWGVFTTVYLMEADQLQTVESVRKSSMPKIAAVGQGSIDHKATGFRC